MLGRQSKHLVQPHTIGLLFNCLKVKFWNRKKNFPLYAWGAIKAFGTTPYHRLSFQLLKSEIL
jgi:hypothetical protein